MQSMRHKQVLNQSLYDRLEATFGSVVIHSEGESFLAKKRKRAFSKNGRYPYYLDIMSSGEYYAVDCPVCGDSRHRLWINHMWGQTFEGMRLNHLCCCYNEGCTELDGFGKTLIDLLDPKTLTSVVKRTTVTVETKFLRELPGTTMSLVELPQEHLLRNYMQKRGFSMEVLDSWGLCWITDSQHPKIHDTNRLLIPINLVQQGREQMGAWQTRYFDYHTGSPNSPSKKIPKYLIQGPTRLIVYNLHNVDTDFIVICEGVFDAIRVGKAHGVCTFGKHLTTKQAELIEDRIISRGGFVVFAFDPDVTAKQWDKLQERIKLWPNTQYLHFPPGVDIADYTQKQANLLVEQIKENIKERI